MIGRLFMGGADGFAPGIGVVGVDVFVLGEGQGLDQGFGRDTTAKSRSLAALGMTRGLAAIALAGLKTRHYTGRRRDRDGRRGGECGSGGHRQR